MCFFFGSFEHLKHIDKRVCLKIDSKINQFLLIFRVKLVGHLLETHLTCIRFYYHQATLSKATVISIFRPRTRPLRRMYALVHRPYLEYRWVVGEVFFFFGGGGGVVGCEFLNPEGNISRWWFQALFIFTPTWGNHPI